MHHSLILATYLPDVTSNVAFSLKELRALYERSQHFVYIFPSFRWQMRKKRGTIVNEADQDSQKLLESTKSGALVRLLSS